MAAHDGDASADLLGRVALFAGLAADARREIAAAASVRTAEAGATFFHEGDPPESFFVVQHGSVKLTQLTPEGHQVVLRLIGRGEAFGGVAIYGGGTYPVTAEAVTSVSAFEWRGPVMAGL